MSGRQLQEQIFNLKFTSKQLVRASKKAEKDEKAEKLKVLTIEMGMPGKACGCRLLTCMLGS